MVEFEKYQGIPMMADIKLHEAVFNEFLKGSPSKDSKILILAAWQGAFDQRLLDNGFANLTAVDIENRYKAKNGNFLLKDLNKDFNDLGDDFDYVFAMEIIEHIENQFHFVRNISKVLKKGGTAFISTPNIAAKTARILFAITGNMSYFDDEAIHDAGHINVIPDHIFRWNVSKSGLTVASKTYNRNCLDIPRKGIKSKVAWVIGKILTALVPGTDGNISIYAIKK